MALVFEDIPIEQLCAKVTTGSTPLRSRRDYYEGGIVDWYKTGELKDWYLDPAEERITDKALNETSVRLFPAETVLMAMYGDGKTITSLGMLRAPAATNQACSAMIVDERKCSPRYLFYALKARRHVLLKMAYGGAQRNLTGKLVREFSLPVPSLTIQRKIVGILSSYDELIENNQRRIRVLEEMARAHYHAWFVDFRFPSYEKGRLVPSSIGLIPEGWEVSRLGDHLAELETGKRPKGGVGEIAEGVPSIGAENIRGIGNHEFTNEKFVPRAYFERMRQGVVHDHDVAIYKDGAYIGRSSYFRDGFPHQECCVNEHVFLLRTRAGRITQNMLYLWLQEPNTIHAIRSTNANAAQPGINQGGVTGLKILAPIEDIASRFDRLVEPMLGNVIALAKQNKNLRQTRDLLLPQLLSGQLNLTEI